MESNPILMKEKLEFFGILREAFAIPLKKAHFMVPAFLTSLPLFCPMVVHEMFLQKTPVELAEIIILDPRHINRSFFHGKSVGLLCHLIEKSFHDFTFLGLYYLGVLYILDLVNTIIVVNSASLIYTGKRPTNLREMLRRSIKIETLKGPLITSTYSLMFSSLVYFVLVSALALAYVMQRFMTNMLLYGLLFFALLMRYVEWSAVLNMGLVISILDDKSGIRAIRVSAYLSRGRRRNRFLLMLSFFLWKLGLRLLCFYVWWHRGRHAILITILSVGLIYFGNVMKWVAFTVCSYDCKKRSLENKVDIEEGNLTQLSKRPLEPGFGLTKANAGRS